MARAPRAKVPKTSGQGISRLAYQQTRALTGGGIGSRGGNPIEEQSSTRSYGKTKPIETPPINISYGDTYEPTDLADIQKLGQRQPSGKAGAALSPGKAKKWSK